MSTISNDYDDDAIVNPSANPHFDTLLAARLSRRQALGGMGGAATGACWARWRCPVAAAVAA